jgi:hypothetical protein
MENCPIRPAKRLKPLSTDILPCTGFIQGFVVIIPSTWRWDHSLKDISRPNIHYSPNAIAACPPGEITYSWYPRMSAFLKCAFL